jgi:hypothetical protein
MRPRRVHTLACVLGKRATLGAMSTIACAAVLASCGGDSEEDEGSIPAQTGTNILSKLDEVEAEVEEGQCDAAAATAAEIQAAIAGLGSSVKGELEETLVEASDSLVTLVRDDCVQEDKPPKDDEEPTGASGEEGVVP